VTIRFPQRNIHGYLTPPDHHERNRRAWLSRIDQALRESGLA
jgi:hypothetical protein